MELIDSTLFSRRDNRDGDRGGRDWNRDRDRDNNQEVSRGPRREGGGAGGGGGGERDRDHRNDNGLTEEEREKRLAEKMPKHKPPEGPVSIGVDSLFQLK